MLMVIVMTIGVLGMTVSVAAEPGTDQDPLITLSYLNDTFMKHCRPQQSDCAADQGRDFRDRQWRCRNFRCCDVDKGTSSDWRNRL